MDDRRGGVVGEKTTDIVRRLCVFCGSRPGGAETFRREADDLGRLLGSRGITLVYGGGRAGLMGIIADATLAAGGEVIGVIPDGLAIREVCHPNVTDMRIVPTMHVRKAMMAELADAFVALPGGLGTFEELFEVWTWAQLGLHDKPIALVNADGYFDPLLRLVDHAVEAGFIPDDERRRLVHGPTARAVFDELLERASAGAGRS